MDRLNPVYIPRNHRVEEALTAATEGELEEALGAVEGPAAWAGWVVKPHGEPYETVEARLREAVDASGGGTVLRRQMVLGPAPEYVVLAASEPSLPWPARATGPHAL